MYHHGVGQRGEEVKKRFALLSKFCEGDSENDCKEHQAQDVWPVRPLPWKSTDEFLTKPRMVEQTERWTKRATFEGPGGGLARVPERFPALILEAFWWVDQSSPVLLHRRLSSVKSDSFLSSSQDFQTEIFLSKFVKNISRTGWSLREHAMQCFYPYYQFVWCFRVSLYGCEHFSGLSVYLVC